MVGALDELACTAPDAGALTGDGLAEVRGCRIAVAVAAAAPAVVVGATESGATSVMGADVGLCDSPGDGAELVTGSECCGTSTASVEGVAGGGTGLT